MYQRGVGVAEGTKLRWGASDGTAYPETKTKIPEIYTVMSRRIVMGIGREGKCRLLPICKSGKGGKGGRAGRWSLMTST